MVEVNEYFEGKVKSLGLKDGEAKRTVGVMEPGDYEFTTAGKEIMTVVEGELSVYLPEYDEWEDFANGATFEIPAQTTFKVKVARDTAYLCVYE